MKPQLIQDIETVLGNRYALQVPQNPHNPLRGVMGYQKDKPRYALDEQGRLIGLNLAGTGLTDRQWSKIADLLDKGGIQLKVLDLFANKLTEFKITSGLERLDYLDLGKNPLDTLPDEVRSQGKDVVRRYYLDLQTQGRSELFEVKMLIVGEGGTGKTTLWNLLQNPEHPVPDEQQKMTVGIQVKEGWKFDHPKRPGEPFLVNLWDFGGQDIQYMTHQFFLSHRAFYVLLADGRTETPNFPYWLQIIELLGCERGMEGRLPVLVVLNERGNSNPKMPFDPATVEEDYKKLAITLRKVEFKDKKYGRFKALKDTIIEILTEKITHLPLVIPTYWNTVRSEITRLRAENVNHINLKRYREICAAAGITEVGRQDELSSLFHQLGILLHFQEDFNLDDFIVLNPQWAVDAVYEILKHETVKDENQGRFDWTLLKRIWTEKGYSEDEQRKLLNLMLKGNLEVCFEAVEGNQKMYIAPQLLPEIKPESHKWEPSTDTLRYIYQYPFMPKGIIGRLIVRLHEFIESQGRSKVVWEKGMVLQKDNCRAQVQYIDDKTQGRKIIKIEVQGPSAHDRKNVLRDISNELEFIHRKSFPSLRVFQRIPCNCPVCEQSKDPFEHDFDRLKENLDLNGDDATDKCGRSFKEISVKKLLEGVFLDMELQRKLNNQGGITIINENKIEMPKQDTNAIISQASSIYELLSVVVVVGFLVLTYFTSMEIVTAIAAIISTIILLALVFTVFLKFEKKITEKSFMELMLTILKKTPPLNLLGKWTKKEELPTGKS